MTRETTPRLYYGGVEVGWVFAVNRTDDTADVLLMMAVVTGTQSRIEMSKIIGRVGRNGTGGRQLSDDEVRAELARRAGIVFGKPPTESPA